MKTNETSKCKHKDLSKNQNYHKLGKLAKFFFPITGLACLIWFLVRVIPKPSRAEYPCMKVAAPVASSFVLYITGLIAAMFSFRKARQYFGQSKYTLAAILALCGLAAGLFFITYDNNQSYAENAASPRHPVFVPTDSANTPIGTARGIHPGRVVWMWDATATTWSGIIGNWWNDAYTHQIVVDSMLSKSLRGLTGKSTDIAAWDTLFKYFNQQHGKSNVGYQAGEKIAIKINIVNFTYSGSAGNQSFTSPQMVLALTRQLVNNAGVPDSLITFYDTQRFIPSAIYTKCRNEFPHVHFMGWDSTAGQEKYVRDTTRVYWSENLTQEQFGGNPTYLSTVVAKASYIINLANFKGHRYMGVTFCSKNHFGSLSCDVYGTPYQNAPHAAGVHYYAAVHDIVINHDTADQWSFRGRPMGTYNPIVDLMGHRDLGAKTLLFMIDALYAVQDEGAFVSQNSKWQSAPFNNNWTSSIFLSQDNVAIESVGLDFFRTEAAINPNDTTIYGSVDNYMHEAALANNPPSGTFYHPNGDTARLPSLGVHEHWNNAADKKYSRNLGTGNGIELFIPQTGSNSVPEAIIPSAYTLKQNYPNPFNPTTTISYSLSVPGFVSLNIYDALGRKVAALVDGENLAGQHQVTFNAKDLSSGIYFYRLQVNQKNHGQSSIFSETKKLVLLK